MMEFLEQMLAWYNFIYTVPLVLIVVYLALHVLGMSIGGGDGLFASFAFFSDDDGRGIDNGFWGSVSRFLCIEQLPLMLLIGILCLCWGIFGNTTNYLFTLATERYVWYHLLISVLFTALWSLGVTRAIIEVLIHIFPAAERPATSAAELVGGTAIVLSARVDATQGRARARDAYGNGITLFCRSRTGEPIGKGEEIVLVDYDTDMHTFEVEKLDVS